MVELNYISAFLCALLFLMIRTAIGIVTISLMKTASLDDRSRSSEDGSRSEYLELAIHKQNEVINQQYSTILHQSEQIRLMEKEREYARLQRKAEEQ